MPINNFFVRRLLTTLVTLWLASLLIFVAGRLFPGDVGRAVLGPFAAPEAVFELNARLGADKPALEQYFDWVGGILHGSLGQSLTLGGSVAPRLWASLVQSSQFASIVIIILVPLAIGAGTLAAFYKGSVGDRVLLLTNISLATVPDFVVAILLVIVFSLWLDWLPVSGPPDGAGVVESVYHLLLPALPLVINLFGYIARIARAGVIRTLETDFVRTAVLKGLPRSLILRRHVLPNALPPTIAVLTTQIGNLLGGIVVIEALFNIKGLGALVATAARSRDYPTLQAGVLTMAAIYAVVTMIGDLIQLALDPRQRERPGG